MKKILIVIVMITLATIADAQITVRTVTQADVNTIPYPNLTGNTTSSQPHPGTVTLKDGTSVHGKITFFKKKGEFERVKVNTGEEKKEIEAAQIASIVLDPKVYEARYPNNFKKPEKNFQPGYIVLPTGEKLTGKVAQVRDLSDYDFFIYTVLFLPEGTSVASSFKSGKLSEFGQEVDGTWYTWDGYADGFLLRMVDGRYRLSRNPYSKTKNEFFTAIKNKATDSLRKQAVQAALVRSLKDGNNVNESIEHASDAGAVVGEVFGSVDINRKEYLIFDTQTNTVTSVNKDSFRDYATSLRTGCAVADDVVSWDKIELFVKALNACP